MEMKKEKIKGMISKLVGEEELEGAVLASRDGLVIVKANMEDEDSIAAMIAAGVASFETAASEWEFGKVESVTVKTSQKELIVVDAGPKAVLGVSSSRENVLEKIKETGKKIEEELKR